MIIALQLSGALLMTVTLLILSVVLAAYELGHRVTRDHEQRQIDGDGSRFTNGSRLLGRRSRAMRYSTALAVVAVLATFAGGSLAHAEAPQECRNQCYVDLENCRDGCAGSGGFHGCETDCGWAYECCADRCDESKTTAG